ncbi:xanthine dehydrogenase-like [Mercenaria mercenaria]|uniref:xanthine dehydrogenase-like n=1 Tax=Mercenaria mercenaria TaxID=6596 RepID=UPI00234F3D16|nr:xanthine dehydrogenase-like [Mercenaria mercenaria]
MEHKKNFISCPVCKTSHVTPLNTRNDGVFASTCENCGHFFKFRSIAPYKSSITFSVNGKQVTVGTEYSSSATLNDFLRQSRLSMGTKVFCKQGGCGICIVVAKMTLNPNGTPVTANINSCLCPLFVCDGWEITTIEGLGSTKTTMHKIQSTLSSFGGTQCGYCSPGHVMNMYGLMQQYPNLTKQDTEDNFEGNLCRCTGYRPILDAMKSLVPATPPDIEDLSTKLCKTTGQPCASRSDNCGGGCSSHGDPRSIQMVFGDTRWEKATDLANLYQILSQTSGQKVRLLGANTGTGYFYEEAIQNFDVVIDISGVPELYVNTHDAQTKTFTLGGCLTLTDLMNIFKREASKVGGNPNFKELKKYLYRVASSPIRNRGTWSGNLMLKNKHHSFPSDIFNIMTVVGASLTIGQTPQSVVICDAFYKTDMTGKCLSKATFKEFGPNDVVACFKVMPRSQNCLAHVNGAFRCAVDKVHGYLVTSRPIISIGGISDTFHRATATEQYLYGKQLSSPATISGALTALAAEVIPTDAVGLTSASYRKTVACALLYKFFLRVLGDSASYQYRSAADVLHDIRPLSSGVQTYDTNKQEWPLNEPLKKLEADRQCTGEAEYTDDLPAYPGQLYASFVTSTEANATVQSINSDEALKIAGVVKVLTSFDIPQGATNDVQPPSSFSKELEPEELFSSGKVMYYGQSLALVIAESQDAADQGARAVKVTYNSIQTPVITIDDAIAAKTYFKKPLPDITFGTPDQAIASAPHQLNGTFATQEQMHFHMETHASVCVPTEDGFDIVTTTQWPDGIQQAVSTVTGIQKSNIDVSVKRLGGAYGGKITRNNIVAAACALAAKLTNRPVRARQTIQTNLRMMGRRFPHKFVYRVGFDDNGKLLGIDMKIYEGQGYLPNEDSASFFFAFIDNAYYCANWKLSVEAMRTNTPMNTSCRAPVSTPAVLAIENMMEKVARSLNKDPATVKQLNFYKEGQRTLVGEVLTHCNIRAVMTELMTSAQVNTRQSLFTFFNKDNRWKKKSLAVVPVKFALSWAYSMYTVTVSVHGRDGSVSVSHGAVEMGQGLNTKVAQVVAYELGIPIDHVTVKTTSSTMSANNNTTGGSVTSEECCKGAIQCCKEVTANMKPVKDKMVNPTWLDLVDKCYYDNIVLSARYSVAGILPENGGDIIAYYSYGAACSEVELDVLTGEYQINRVDIVYDCGESLNPAVDIGQVEGSFVMGLGYSLTEEIAYDPKTGKMFNNDTWGYHPPTNKDIPVDFRISLLKNAPNPSGVLRSKASGEPPLNTACSTFFALRNCIEEARKDAGQTGEFDFQPPATIEKVQMACLVDPSQFAI